MFIIKDPVVLSATLSQKENHPPKLIIQKPIHAPYREHIEILSMFEGMLSNIMVKDDIRILEYVMPFQNPTTASKEVMFGNPDHPNSHLEDTEHTWHFNRRTKKVELSHIVTGLRTHKIEGPILLSQTKRPHNLKATVTAKWIYEQNIMMDLMPYIGPHIDTYTPVHGLHSSEELEIKGPYDGKTYLKKIRQKGPFYHAIKHKTPTEESLEYKLDYKSDQTEELVFHIAQAYGEAFLDTLEGEKWKAHIKKMLFRMHLLQCRCEFITVQVPFLDVTLDDEIVMGDKRGKVVEYSMTPFLTVITFAVHKDAPYALRESALQTVREVKENAIVVKVKSDAVVQEEFLAQKGSVKDLPRTVVEVTSSS
ncbi:MAG: hypothetical protein H6850_02250 [Alphaproteobacteria bacterium]|nr:MAG: hypothetical protein H6850_02250 [Alphaproteobacteria bacterium]